MNDADTTPTPAPAPGRSSSPAWLQVLRVVFFFAGKDELSNFSYKHLAIGLLCTWIVGIGRYWDDPCAYPLQHLGLGSVFYVFLLSFLLWLVFLPLRPSKWSYRQVLTYVTLTSPPAIIYAIPVEQFMSMKNATTANLYFLIIVAVWRVLLMGQYLRLVARLPLLHRLVGMIFPVTTVITMLFLFDQHRAVFEVMGGFRHHLNPQEDADIFLNQVVGSCWVICPFAAVIYVVLLFMAWRKDFLRLVCRHKVAVSVLSLILVAGISYAAMNGVPKSPSDMLCEQADRLDNLKDAKLLCSKAIALEPRSARAYDLRAKLNEAEGCYLAALDDANRAVSLDRGQGDYLARRAGLLYELGRTAEALNDSREARRLRAVSSIWEAFFPFTYFEGFRVLAPHLGQLPNSSAWQSLQFSFCSKFADLAWMRMPHGSIDREDAWARIEDIPKLWHLQKLDEALENCNFIVSEFALARGSATVSSQVDECVEDSDFARACKMRGYTYELMGKSDQALSDYERALSVVKDDPQALFLKARLLKRRGRESEARETLELVKAAVVKTYMRNGAKYMEFTAASKACSGTVARYIELMTAAEMGQKNKALALLIIDSSAAEASGRGKEKSAPVSSAACKGALNGSFDKESVFPIHYGDAWSEDCYASDLSLPVIHWETGKVLQLLGMRDSAQAHFRAAIACFENHQPEPRNRLSVLVWRARIYRSLGDKNGEMKAFQQARLLGYSGSMLGDDLSDVDARFLVTME